MINVSLFSATPQAEKIVYAAGRLCYSDKFLNEIFLEVFNIPDEKIENFLAGLRKSGHLSPFEHISFTFGIEGISRACSHQLVRHRIASFSQQSQRYVASDDEHVIPDVIANNSELLSRYEDIYNDIMMFYDDAVNSGIKKEDARFLLPNAQTTRLFMTMNARELYHFFRLRCCNRAQWEIREVADKMLALCKTYSPILFKGVGPDCVLNGCKETSPCGKPRLELKN